MSTIRKGSKVRVTGDAVKYLHERQPGTVGVVCRIDGDAAKVRVTDDPTGAEANDWWVGIADLQPVGRGKGRNRVFRVEIEHDGQTISTRISAPSAREALEAAHKALVVRVYEDK